VCCSVLQCVAVCCSVLQCVAVCCSQCIAVWTRDWQKHTAPSGTTFLYLRVCVCVCVCGCVRACVCVLAMCSTCVFCRAFFLASNAGEKARETKELVKQTSASRHAFLFSAALRSDLSRIALCTFTISCLDILQM